MTVPAVASITMSPLDPVVVKERASAPVPAEVRSREASNAPA